MRVPFSDVEPTGDPLTPLELLEVYQRALYEALTTRRDETPDWAYLIHGSGVAVVMDPDAFVSGAGGSAQETSHE